MLVVVAVTYSNNCSGRRLLIPCSKQPEVVSKCADPLTQFGNDCACFDTAYFGNNIVFGWDNKQPSWSACQQSCAEHAGCAYWTWRQRAGWGPCYLKGSRAGGTHKRRKGFVSGSMACLHPDQGRGLHGHQ